jgi:CheY-like chemotaxis protein
MEWENLIKPRVLVVEDQVNQWQAVEVALKITDSRKELGLDSFVPQFARNVKEAETLLAQNSPYDFLLLDLGIPRADGEPDFANNGQELLERVQREGEAKQVIVISIWFVVDQVARAFRSGAVDFVAKPFTTDQLQAQVIKCWKHLLVKESTRLLEKERISELIEYAEKGLAHRFTTCFSSIVRTVAHTSEDIEQYVQERYGLDRKKYFEDLFFTYLNSQDDSISKAKRDWAALTAPLQSPNESSGSAKVETLLKGVHESVLPCLIVKKITLEFFDEGATEILTFEDDVHAVLKEMILGAASKLPDFNEVKQVIEIKVENADGQVKLRCSDLLEPIAPDLAKSINEGSTISPALRFGREWGLSVVQHIAMRGGGRLEIEPQAAGNIITYLIPSAG